VILVELPHVEHLGRYFQTCISNVAKSYKYRVRTETEAIMLQSDDLGGAPPMDFKSWRALLDRIAGRDVEVTAPNAFAGWMRPFNACGLEATSVKIRWGVRGPRLL